MNPPFNEDLINDAKKVARGWISWFLATSNPTVYTPTAVAVPTGTINNLVTTQPALIASVSTMFDNLTVSGSGSITNDGNALFVQEVSGTPGYEIDFTFSNVNQTPTEVVLRAWYNGNNNHDVELEFYNNKIAAWDLFHNIPQNGFDYTIWSLPLVNFGNYMANGVVKCRLYHVTGGVPAHSVAVDYIALRQS